MHGAKIMAVSPAVNIPIDLKHVAGNLSGMTREEPIHIIAIKRSAAIPAMTVREWFQAPQVSPSREPASAKNAEQARRPRRPEHSLYFASDRLL
jgi:hypothetical protein